MGLFGTTKKTGVETPQPRPESSIVALTESNRIAPTAPGFRSQTYLGKYETLKFLGEGSNAQVFLARVIRSPDRLVVVKRIKEEAASAPRFRQFFDAEVRSMARFRHPYVVRLLDASLDDPHGPCLVLEYIVGHTLEIVLQREQRMSPDRLGRFLGPLGHALYAAQLAGIAHRDLKPANLMVTDYGTDRESLRVMDFGFAGFTHKPHIQLAELTGQGTRFACGTPAYVSPEMVRGDSTDIRADIYSVGVMMFELLTGRLPFEHRDQKRLLEAHVHDSPPRFHRIGCSHIPPSVEGVVQHALSKYPSERPPSMKDLVAAYGRAVGWDVWAMTAPPGMTPDDDDSGALGSVFDMKKAEQATGRMPKIPAAASASDAFVFSDVFEATMPEKLAALKLRGFIEDVGGEVLESEPGLIRVRLEMPSGYRETPTRSSGSGVFAFLSGVIRTVPSVRAGHEPIEIELKMDKRDADKVAVLVCFRPIKDFMPQELKTWKERCEAYYAHLRKFIMPQG